MNDYRLVIRNEHYDFVDRVNDLIRRGYKPIGGVCHNDGRYVQAMLKESNHE